MGNQGEMGYQGDKGDRGADGYQGEMGQQGRMGNQGEMGYQGNKGDRGFTGYQGEMGQQGAKGYQGDKGADGTMSFEDLTPEQKATLKGDQGVQGAQGDRGNDGDQGVQGDIGEKGYQGDAGVQGPKGDSTGVVGPQGTQGDRGNDGVQGAQGDIGEKGYQGDAGVQGPKGDSTGVVGPQGTQGTRGDKGDRGPQGYGASSPAAELPKVFIKNWVGDLNHVNFNLSILYNNCVFDNLQRFFEPICGTMEQIDADVWANDENYPNPERFSTNKAFAMLIDGDFDAMRLLSNNYNSLSLQRLSGTKKMPTWLSITIAAKASLFNFQNKQYTVNGVSSTEPISDTDYISILGYTYIDLSQAPWNKQNTTL